MSWTLHISLLKKARQLSYKKTAILPDRRCNIKFSNLLLKHIEDLPAGTAAV